MKIEAARAIGDGHCGHCKSRISKGNVCFDVMGEYGGCIGDSLCTFECAEKVISDASINCPRCNKKVPHYEVHERYSFGVYAGKFCNDCCAGYRDNCGLDQAQGNPADLDEDY